MGGGGGGGGPQIIPFNMGELAPFMPSVFQGPYGADSAVQNEQMIEAKYPWITPPAGQFTGATAGNFPGSSPPGQQQSQQLRPGTFGFGLGGGSGGGSGQFGFQGSGVPNPAFQGLPSPNAPPPTAQQVAQFNPSALAGNQVNAMMPNSVQQILSILNAQSPPIGPTAQGPSPAPSRGV